MAILKIQMVLNPGGVGVRFHKLALVSEEFEKLFRYLAEDLGIQSGTDDWLARDFINSSVGYNVEYSKPVDPVVVEKYNGFVAQLVDFRESAPPVDAQITTRTLKQYVRAGKVLDNDEQIVIGLYRNGGDPDPKYLRKTAPLELERILETPITYHGSVQGRTGTWYKGSDYFDLRDMLFNETVKCSYPRALYGDINKAYEDPDALVHVVGLISSNRIEKRPMEVRVSRIKAYDRLSDAEFKKFYGIAPDMTGGESTGDYISRIREEDGEA